MASIDSNTCKSCGGTMDLVGSVEDTDSDIIRKFVGSFLSEDLQIQEENMEELLNKGNDDIVSDMEFKRAGMYFGMSGFLITLSGLLVSSVLRSAHARLRLRYAPRQAACSTVDLGFRIFLTVPTSIGFLFAIFLLWLYPLNGDKLKQIKETLQKKRAASNE